MVVSGQEICESRPCLCATVCFGHSGQEIVNTVANALYADARSGKMSIPGFPCFEPIITALKNEQTFHEAKSLRVTAQRHDTLLVLESMAKRWTENETTCDRARTMIESHNESFNSGGDYWLSERLGTIKYQETT